MKSTKVTTNEGRQSHSTNFMLDDVIEAFDKRMDNDGSNDELIKELAIQKIEYGRLCILQLMHTQHATEYLINSCKQLDEELQQRIIEIGGIPK